jgi:hypothetical protein
MNQSLGRSIKITDDAVTIGFTGNRCDRGVVPRPKLTGLSPYIVGINTNIRTIALTKAMAPDGERSQKFLAAAASHDENRPVGAEKAIASSPRIARALGYCDRIVNALTVNGWQTRRSWNRQSCTFSLSKTTMLLRRTSAPYWPVMVRSSKPQASVKRAEAYHATFI